jgi:hypothetical protein
MRLHTGKSTPVETNCPESFLVTTCIGTIVDEQLGFGSEPERFGSQT